MKQKRFYHFNDSIPVKFGRLYDTSQVHASLSLCVLLLCIIQTKCTFPLTAVLNLSRHNLQNKQTNICITHSNYTIYCYSRQSNGVNELWYTICMHTRAIACVCVCGWRANKYVTHEPFETFTAQITNKNRKTYNFFWLCVRSVIWFVAGARMHWSGMSNSISLFSILKFSTTWRPKQNYFMNI